jgi:UDP-N-acetylglucosamine 4,6-dehydratase/5-epimerase
MNFENTNLLITGGTGSFGKKFVELTLKKHNPKSIVVYSRDEMKQWEMQQYFNSDKLKFIIGDIRDDKRILESLEGIDYVVHAAATKIVNLSESNPLECIKTNILGSANLISACKSHKIKKVVSLSTDKASNPINLYGATKLAADKLFSAESQTLSNSKTKFAIVRYGNVIGSRGSVIPFFKEQEKKGFFTITDKKMTRFMIDLNQAVNFVWLAFEKMIGGEIFVKKLPSMSIIDIANAINPKIQKKYIGIRPGEKLHEQMISNEEYLNTVEFKKYFKIIPSTTINKRPYIKGGKLVNSNFNYNSNNNKERMTSEDLKKIIDSSFN